MYSYILHDYDSDNYCYSFSASHPLLEMETGVPWTLMVMAILISHLIQQHVKLLKECQLITANR